MAFLNFNLKPKNELESGGRASAPVMRIENEPEKMADVFLKFGVQNVIIKLGAKGCYLKNEKGAYRLPAYDINAVDATGAGDNFVAAFASEILRGAEAYDALCFANACGAICTTAVGAATALKSRRQVIAWMRSFSPGFQPLDAEE